MFLFVFISFGSPGQSSPHFPRTHTHATVPQWSVSECLPDRTAFLGTWKLTSVLPQVTWPPRLCVDEKCAGSVMMVCGGSIWPWCSPLCDQDKRLGRGFADYIDLYNSKKSDASPTRITPKGQYCCYCLCDDYWLMLYYLLLLHLSLARTHGRINLRRGVDYYMPTSNDTCTVGGYYVRLLLRDNLCPFPAWECTTRVDLYLSRGEQGCGLWCPLGLSLSFLSLPQISTPRNSSSSDSWWIITLPPPMTPSVMLQNVAFLPTHHFLSL